MEEPLAWQLGHFPGPTPSLQGQHVLSCTSGGQEARVQGLSLCFPWLSSGTELALVPQSQGFPSTHTIPGRDQARACWESAQGFFPGSSGKRSRERLKVSQRRGRGRGRTKPCLAVRRNPWGSGKMGRSTAAKAVPFSVGPGEGWPALVSPRVHSDPWGAHCVPGLQAKCRISWKP